MELFGYEIKFNPEEGLKYLSYVPLFVLLYGLQFLLSPGGISASEPGLRFFLELTRFPFLQTFLFGIYMMCCILIGPKLPAMMIRQLRRPSLRSAIISFAITQQLLWMSYSTFEMVTISLACIRHDMCPGYLSGALLHYVKLIVENITEKSAVVEFILLIPSLYLTGLSTFLYYKLYQQEDDDDRGDEPNNPHPNQNSGEKNENDDAAMHDANVVREIVDGIVASVVKGSLFIAGGINEGDKSAVNDEVVESAANDEAVESVANDKAGETAENDDDGISVVEDINDTPLVKDKSDSPAKQMVANDNSLETEQNDNASVQQVEVENPARKDESGPLPVKNSDKQDKETQSEGRSLDGDKVCGNCKRQKQNTCDKETSTIVYIDLTTEGTPADRKLVTASTNTDNDREENESTPLPRSTCSTASDTPTDSPSSGRKTRKGKSNQSSDSINVTPIRKSTRTKKR